MAHQGVVKFFDDQRGYGFIEPVTGESDVFVHISAVKKSGCGDLLKGDRIAYELVTSRNGKQMAANLRVHMRGQVS